MVLIQYCTCIEYFVGEMNAWQKRCSYRIVGTAEAEQLHLLLGMACVETNYLKKGSRFRG